ncbi:Heparin cofactor 2 [Eumeta japonica]|uniref:Heparin cofactor 2 n=1 Tax=Eumeta variegata TaxID=151549 RepID=A0A4C1ZZT3_EUMVA|nr:Heparin cofactor 2 [Eumeta japonica]
MVLKASSGGGGIVGELPPLDNDDDLMQKHRTLVKQSFEKSHIPNESLRVQTVRDLGGKRRVIKKMDAQSERLRRAVNRRSRRVVTQCAGASYKSIAPWIVEPFVGVDRRVCVVSNRSVAEINQRYISVSVTCVGLALSSARWLRGARAGPPKATAFVGEATNELSTAIFQVKLLLNSKFEIRVSARIPKNFHDQSVSVCVNDKLKHFDWVIDDDRNIAFSPLGYSAILAILAEGADGETRQQLATALHLPDDPQLTRKTYKFIMERLKNRNVYKYNRPELKNYFYVYKNYTINDDYKRILEDYYLTEVRSIERYNPETIKDDDHDDDDNDAINIKDNIEKKPMDSESKEKLITFAVEDNPRIVDISSMEYKPAKNIKEKIKLAQAYPKKEYIGEEEEETMVAVEARNHAKSYSILPDKNDVISSISVNSVGKKSNMPTSPSLMIMFNGMYFRGAWKEPFEIEEPGLFYKSSIEKTQVPMLKTRGTFKTGSIPGLDSDAIELPYDGGRYALLVILPRARDGLARLVVDLPAAPLADIQEYMEEETLDVSLPSFYVETTTKPVAALAKASMAVNVHVNYNYVGMQQLMHTTSLQVLVQDIGFAFQFGVSSIFGRDADLSRVSPIEGLFVQELVQYVTVRVDNADASATGLTASNAVVEELKNLPLSQETTAKKFCVDHPFLFFIIDRIDNLIVVAGKVTDPEQLEPFDI